MGSSRNLSWRSPSAPRSCRPSGCGEQREEQEGVVSKRRTRRADRFVLRCFGLNGCAASGLMGQVRESSKVMSSASKIVKARRPRIAAPARRSGIAAPLLCIRLKEEVPITANERMADAWFQHPGHAFVDREAVIHWIVFRHPKQNLKAL